MRLGVPPTCSWRTAASPTVGDVGPVDAEEIDAAGLAVGPGFVDLHSHSDYTLLVDPRAVSAIHQGVTTEVVGNCGFGCFPIRDPDTARRAIYGYSDDLPLTWSSAGEYFERLDAARPAVNVLSLVPNGQLRLATLGLADRPADDRELAEMEALCASRSTRAPGATRPGSSTRRSRLPRRAR